MSAGNLHVEARDRDIIVTMPQLSCGHSVRGHKQRGRARCAGRGEQVDRDERRPITAKWL